MTPCGRAGREAGTKQPFEHRVRVVFDQPQRAVTPGQSVVFYDADACLGGAVIEETR